MVDTPLTVGFIGCGGISRELYVQMYAGLADIAQVVAVADPVGELAEERRRMLTNAYLEEASRRSAGDRHNRAFAEVGGKGCISRLCKPGDH